MTSGGISISQKNLFFCLTKARKSISQPCKARYYIFERFDAFDEFDVVTVSFFSFALR
nr:MAG TPA: hypothetical protein [Caudoviricetes sp.]